MIAHLTRASFCVPLTEAQWDKLQDLDGADFEMNVSLPIVKAGGFNVEFSGHFGMNIFFDMDADEEGRVDCTPVVRALEEMLGDA